MSKKPRLNVGLDARHKEMLDDLTEGLDCSQALVAKRGIRMVHSVEEAYAAGEKIVRITRDGEQIEIRYL